MLSLYNTTERYLCWELFSRLDYRNVSLCSELPVVHSIVTSVTLPSVMIIALY